MTKSYGKGLRVEVQRGLGLMSLEEMESMRPATNRLLAEEDPWDTGRHTKILATLYHVIEHDPAQGLEMFQRYLPTLVYPRTEESRSRDAESSILEHEMILIDFQTMLDRLLAHCRESAMDRTVLRDELEMHTSDMKQRMRQLEAIIEGQRRSFNDQLMQQQHQQRQMEESIRQLQGQQRQPEARHADELRQIKEQLHHQAREERHEQHHDLVEERYAGKSRRRWWWRMAK